MSWTRARYPSQLKAMMIATSPSTEIEAVMKRIKPAHKDWEFRVAGTNGGYAGGRRQPTLGFIVWAYPSTE